MENEKPVALTRLEEMAMDGQVAHDHFTPDHPLAFMNGVNLYHASPTMLRALAAQFISASIAFLSDQEAYTTCLMTMMRLHAAAELREQAGVPDSMDVREFFNRLGPSSNSVN